MGDYKPGEMDIQEQRAMYDAFWAWTTRTTVAVIVILALMYLFLV